MEVSGQPYSPAALPQVKSRSIHRIGGWVYQRASLDVVTKTSLTYHVVLCNLLVLNIFVLVWQPVENSEVFIMYPNY